MFFLMIFAGFTFFVNDTATPGIASGGDVNGGAEKDVKRDYSDSEKSEELDRAKAEPSETAAEEEEAEQEPAK